MVDVIDHRGHPAFAIFRCSSISVPIPVSWSVGDPDSNTDVGRTATHSKVKNGWADGMDWILLRKLVLLEHLPVLTINHLRMDVAT